jgi:hypothetical protein
MFSKEFRGISSSFLSKVYLKYDFIIDGSNNAGVIVRLITWRYMILE